MTKFIDENEHYWVSDVIHYCCDEMQFRHICKLCEDSMDCYFCGFDPYGPHGCDTL